MYRPGRSGQLSPTVLGVEPGRAGDLRTGVRPAEIGVDGRITLMWVDSKPVVAVAGSRHPGDGDRLAATVRRSAGPHAGLAAWCRHPELHGRLAGAIGIEQLRHVRARGKRRGVDPCRARATVCQRPGDNGFAVGRHSQLLGLPSVVAIVDDKRSTLCDQSRPDRYQGGRRCRFHLELRHDSSVISRPRRDHDVGAAPWLADQARLGHPRGTTAEQQVDAVCGLTGVGRVVALSPSAGRRAR